jgi:hypothetical protein
MGFTDLTGTPFTNPGNNNPLFLGGPGSLVIINPALPAACSANVGTVVLASSSSSGQPVLLVSASGGHKLLLSKSGELAVFTLAGVMVQSIATSYASCLGPFRLVLQPNGNLELQDSKGRVYWSSQSGCLGQQPGCYTVVLGSDGVLRVVDSTGGAVWASRAATGGGAQLVPGAKRPGRLGAQPASSGTATNTTSTSTTVPGKPVQLHSAGTPRVACIYAAVIKGAASSLASRDGKYLLSIGSKSGLQLASAASQAVVWTPATGGSKAKASSLCLAPNGTLVLWGSKAGAVLWQSALVAQGGIASWDAPRALRSRQTYVAAISSQGQLVVMDSQCSQVYPAQQARTPAPDATTSARPPEGAQLVQVKLGAPKLPLTTRLRPPSPSPPTPLPPAAGSLGQTIRLKARVSEELLPTQQSQAQPKGQISPSPRLDIGGRTRNSAISGTSSTSTTASASTASTASSASSANSGFASAATVTHSAVCLPGAHKVASIGSLCGGSNLCGLDIPCRTAACCVNGLTCRRRNAYTWMCLL